MTCTEKLSVGRAKNGAERPVHILVLNWNNWRDTNECLASLQNLDYGNYKVVVLDNGSSDGSVREIRTRFPAIEIMELGENFGFAKGNNAGIQDALESGAEYVWILNNDTTVTPRSLVAMVEKMRVDPRLGAVGSVLFFMNQPDKMQIWGGACVNFWFGAAKAFERPVSEKKLDYLSGASLLISRSALLNVGLLDEGFFMYWEDADYCFRLRKSGFLLGVACDSKVLHKGSGSFKSGSGVLDAYFTRSSRRFFQKYATFPLFSFWMGVSRRMLKRVITGKWVNLRAVWSEATTNHARVT